MALLGVRRRTLPSRPYGTSGSKRSQFAKFVLPCIVATLIMLVVLLSSYQAQNLAIHQRKVTASGGIVGASGRVAIHLDSKANRQPGYDGNDGDDGHLDDKDGGDHDDDDDDDDNDDNVEYGANITKSDDVTDDDDDDKNNQDGENGNAATDADDDGNTHDDADAIDSKKSKNSEKSNKSKNSPTQKSERSNKSKNSPTHYEVIIGGAGTAGIAVAHTLQREAGIHNYAILEGKDDIGGRMKAVKFGTSEEEENQGGFSIETGSNYISGGVLNPFYCQMMKLKKEMKGYNQEWKIRVNDESGKKILGDFDEDWKYDWDENGEPKNAAQRMVRAHGNAEWYARHCLQKKSGAVVSKWCNDLCNINVTQLLGGGMGIDDLKVTNRTVCNKQGEFLPGDHADMSITDIMRLDGYFAQNDTNGTCVARVIEYAMLDIELGRAPWEVSAKHWLNGGTFSGDFGKERDFLVFDDRSYLFLLKAKASKVLDTSKNTDNEILIKDNRLLLNKKITKIYWDPDGETDVIVTYCNTKKVNEYSFPCTNDSRYNVTTVDFVSTFSMGVLKNSLELELSSNSMNSDDIAPMFYPPLSSVSLIKNNLDNAEMGSLIKVFMQFKCKFWEDKELFFTPYSKDGFQCDYAPTFFSLDGEKGHKGSNILSLITSGNRAQDLSKPENQEPEMIYKQFLPVLNTHFKEGISTCLADEGLNRTELTKEDMIDFFIPDWFNDPLVRGCWLSKPYGASAEEYAEFLAKGPRFGNLMFSGEGTCKRHTGWVHGGWFSGERSARILLKERKDGFENYDTQTLCDSTPNRMIFDDDTCEWVPKSFKDSKDYTIAGSSSNVYNTVRTSRNKHKAFD